MSKSAKVIIALVVLILLGLVLWSGPESNSTGNKVMIGVINPLTGPAGSMGEEVANAVKVASSTSSTLLFEDDQCDGKKAISSYLKLKQEGVKIFYISCSGSVMAVAPLAKQDGNLIVTAYAGSAEIRKTGDEVIRFVPDAVSIGERMASYVGQISRPMKLGLLYEEQDYAKSAALVLEEKLGSAIVATERYTATDTTFRTQILKLKSAGIDTLLYVPTSDKAAQLVFKEMQTLVYKPFVVGDVNTCGYSFLPQDFGLEAVCFDAGFPIETAGYQAFLASYKNQYGIESNLPFYDAITYDIITLIDDFGKKHDPTHPDFVSDLKKYLLKGVKGQMAEYSFTPEGEVVAENYLIVRDK